MRILSFDAALVGALRFAAHQLVNRPVINKLAVV